MYVCICNAITDDQIARIVSEAGAKRPSTVWRALNARPQCGKCHECLCETIRHSHQNLQSAE